MLGKDMIGEPTDNADATPPNDTANTMSTEVARMKKSAVAPYVPGV